MPAIQSKVTSPSPPPYTHVPVQGIQVGCPPEHAIPRLPALPSFWAREGRGWEAGVRTHHGGHGFVPDIVSAVGDGGRASMQRNREKQGLAAPVRSVMSPALHELGAKPLRGL
eukprot:765748-Hanusia_phi.AAC.4